MPSLAVLPELQYNNEPYSPARTKVYVVVVLSLLSSNVSHPLSFLATVTDLRGVMLPVVRVQHSDGHLPMGIHS